MEHPAFGGVQEDRARDAVVGRWQLAFEPSVRDPWHDGDGRWRGPWWNS